MPLVRLEQHAFHGITHHSFRVSTIDTDARGFRSVLINQGQRARAWKRSCGIDSCQCRSALGVWEAEGLFRVYLPTTVLKGQP